MELFLIEKCSRYDKQMVRSEYVIRQIQDSTRSLVLPIKEQWGCFCEEIWSDGPLSVPRDGFTAPLSVVDTLLFVLLPSGLSAFFSVKTRWLSSQHDYLHVSTVIELILLTMHSSLSSTQVECLRCMLKESHPQLVTHKLHSQDSMSDLNHDVSLSRKWQRTGRCNHSDSTRNKRTHMR